MSPSGISLSLAFLVNRGGATVTGSDHLKHQIDERFQRAASDSSLTRLGRNCFNERYAATKEILSDPSVEDRISVLGRDTMAYLDSIAEQLALRQNQACQSGCAFCCSLRVDVLVPQAINIAQYLRKRLSSEQWENLRCRLSDRVQHISTMTADEHAVANLPCVFLRENNTCLIYPARPTKCATYNSLSVEKCKEGFDHPTDWSIQIPIGIAQGTIGDGVSGGLSMACVRLGLDHWGYELHSAVLRAMELPDAGSRWLAGERVFRSCITTGVDTRHSDKEMRKMAEAIEGGSHVGRNSPCPCGSGKKYKKCCIRHIAS